MSTAVPAKATSATLSPSSRSTRSLIAIFARSRRLGARSSASMLRETSRMKTMSRPRLSTVCGFGFQAGLASETAIKAKAATTSAAFQRRFWGLEVSLMRPRSSESTKAARALRRLTPAQTKRSTRRGVIQRRPRAFTFPKCIVITESF